MNNVITILIDSLIWECVGTKRTKISTTPFMDSLKKESLTASKLYSHGPYTDAATKSLYTGRNCLDDFAYYYRLNKAPNNHFKTFHDAGYETYGVYYPYYTIGNGIKQHIDHTYYSAGFVFKSEWGGIFNYYAKIVKERDLTQEEWALLCSRAELMFECWLSYYNELITAPESAVLISEIVKSVDIKDKFAILQREHVKFQESPKDYLHKLLGEGMQHPLANLDDIDIDRFIDRDWLRKDVYKKYERIFSKFKKSNIKANIVKNAPSIKRLLYGFSQFLKTRNIDEVKFLANYFVCLSDIQKNIDHSFVHWQDIPSARKHFRFAADIIKKHTSEKPFYLSLHILDPHNYISFFSYDMLEDSTVKEEMMMLEKFVDGLGTEYVGSLAFFLSIRYVDFCVEELCNSLKEHGKWDNTTILFIADHGSSYSFHPLHGARVNCFDDECYHVPMLLRSPKIVGQDIKEYYNLKDVFPTLFDVLGIKKPNAYKGHSMLDINYSPKPYVITEYMGPGCPDLLSRPIWFSIRDEKYVIAYKVGIYQHFEEGDLCEVYDLTKDPNTFYNINKKINYSQIQYLINPIRERFEEVKIETSEFIEELRQNINNRFANESSNFKLRTW